MNQYEFLAAQTQFSRRDQLQEVILQAIENAQEVFTQHTSVEIEVEGAGGFGSLYGDSELNLDTHLRTTLETALSQCDIIRRITIEGRKEDEPLIVNPHGIIDVFGDPLDGSLAMLHKGDALGLPVSVGLAAYPAQTLFDKKLQFGDLICGAALDFRCCDLWYLNQDGCFFKGLPARTQEVITVDIKKSIVATEMYYGLNRWVWAVLFSDQPKGWLRNISSALIEQLYVASGQFIAYLSAFQKRHEPVFTVRAIESAGGVVLDWDGKPFRSLEIDFYHGLNTPFLAAANLSVANWFLKRLPQAKQVAEDLMSQVVNNRPLQHQGDQKI